MNVLVVFATIEGQTGKIAGFVRDEVARAGHDVTLVDLSQERGPVPVGTFAIRVPGV